MSQELTLRWLILEVISVVQEQDRGSNYMNQRVSALFIFAHWGPFLLALALPC